MSLGGADKKSRYISKINYLHNEYFYFKHTVDNAKTEFIKALNETISKLNEMSKNSNPKNEKKTKVDLNPKVPEMTGKTFRKKIKDIGDNSENKKDNDNTESENKEEELEEYNPFSFDKKKFINKLYYKISKIIHPDKTDDEIKKSFFKLCKKSKDDQLLYKLILVAEKFNILYSFQQEYFEILDLEIKNLNTNIQNIQNNYILLWKNETDPQKKRQILINYILKK
tara:strand:- start:363 stop:1040 length:678 start_codon:yes stop_codon:yes gene_type:complete